MVEGPKSGSKLVNDAFACDARGSPENERDEGGVANGLGEKSVALRKEVFCPLIATSREDVAAQC